MSGLHDALHLGLAEQSDAQSFATGDTDYKILTQVPMPLHVVQL